MTISISLGSCFSVIVCVCVCKREREREREREGGRAWGVGWFSYYFTATPGVKINYLISVCCHCRLMQSLYRDLLQCAAGTFTPHTHTCTYTYTHSACLKLVQTQISRLITDRLSCREWSGGSKVRINIKILNYWSYTVCYEGWLGKKNYTWVALGTAKMFVSLCQADCVIEVG